jgi:hypothetical protein
MRLRDIRNALWWTLVLNVHCARFSSRFDTFKEFDTILQLVLCFLEDLASTLNWLQLL